MADISVRGKRKMPSEPQEIAVTHMKSAPTPTGIRAPHGATVFEISFNNGEIHRIPHEILRGYCPCAGCQGHGGSIRFQPTSPGIARELREIAEVGRYALALTWGDSHSTGIYPFEYLRRLGLLISEHGADGVIALEELPRNASVVLAGES